MTRRMYKKSFVSIEAPLYEKLSSNPIWRGHRLTSPASTQIASFVFTEVESSTRSSFHNRCPRLPPGAAPTRPQWFMACAWHGYVINDAAMTSFFTPVTGDDSSLAGPRFRGNRASNLRWEKPWNRASGTNFKRRDNSSVLTCLMRPWHMPSCLVWQAFCLSLYARGEQRRALTYCHTVFACQAAIDWQNAACVFAVWQTELSELSTAAGEQNPSSSESHKRTTHDTELYGTSVKRRSVDGTGVTFAVYGHLRTSDHSVCPSPGSEKTLDVAVVESDFKADDIRLLYLCVCIRKLR